MVKQSEITDARRAGAVQSIIVSLWFILTGAFLGAAWFANGPSLTYELLGVFGLLMGSVFMAAVVRAARAVGRLEAIQHAERWRRQVRSIAN